MTDRDAIDEMQTLVASENRVEILRILHQHGAVDKRTLRERVDVSRPTLERNLDTLEEAGWIRRRATRYSITVAGEMIADPFSELLGTVEIATRLQPLLRWTSGSDLDLNPDLLTDVELTVSDPSNPYAPANRFVEHLQETREFRAFLAVVARDATEIVWRRVTDGRMSVELVLTPEAAETVQSDPSFAEMIADLLRSDQFEIYVYDGDIPFFLGLLDDDVHIGVEDDAGVPKALAVSQNERVRAWAQEKYQGVREAARRVSDSGSA